MARTSGVAVAWNDLAGGGSAREFGSQRLPHGGETHLSRRSFPSRGGGQEGRKARVHHHYHAHERVKAAGPGDVAVGGAPSADLQTPHPAGKTIFPSRLNPPIRLT